MTINEAIKKVILDHGVPMTADEAYRAIIKGRLYEFHSDNPAHIVRSQIRRHCIGLDFPSAAPTKHFTLTSGNRYWPLDEPIRHQGKLQSKRKSNQKVHPKNSLAKILMDLQALSGCYASEFRKKMLIDLKNLSPNAFENFACRLLDAYGFHEMKVTQVSGDGGIDGYGKLKVGLAFLNVAFQCKRWKKGNIHRPEVDRFRGAIQGDFEQGLFFTTASFSKGAIEASIKRGAVPIVLVDGEAIIELMIRKGFGVQTENISIPTYALDIALSNVESPFESILD